MYFLISSAGAARFATLLDFFAFADKQSPAWHANIEAATLVAADFSRVVLEEMGERVRVRLPGQATDVIHGLLCEHWRTHFQRGGRGLLAYEVSAQAWEAAMHFFVVSRSPARFLSGAQHCEVGTNPGEVLANVSQQARLVLGFDERGLPCGFGPQPHDSHAMHVGHALLSGATVPPTVLREYQARARIEYGQEWISLLVAFPALGGRVKARHAQSLALLWREDLELTDQTVPCIAAALRSLPQDATYIEVDDCLFAHGLLAPLTAEVEEVPVDIGTPTSALAEAIHRHTSNAIFNHGLRQIEDDRRAGRMSKRRYDQAMLRNELSQTMRSYSYANKMASAIEGAEMELVLPCLDSPDTRNRGCKQAVYEVLGVKIIGLKPGVRRRIVFSLCGLNEAQQAAWEAERARRQAVAQLEHVKREARRKAESARYRTMEGRRLTGAEYVEESLAAGYTSIRSSRIGATQRYRLERPGTSVSRNLSAKDGTLEYARQLLVDSVVSA